MRICPHCRTVNEDAVAACVRCQAQLVPIGPTTTGQAPPIPPPPGMAPLPPTAPYLTRRADDSAPPTTNGLAIAALILAFFVPLVGLVLGIVAHSQIKQSGGRQTGRGLATAGIAVSGGLMVLVVALLYPVFLLARGRAQASNCISNQAQIARVFEMRAQEEGGRYIAYLGVWNDLGLPADLLRCPDDVTGKKPGYGLNSELLGINQRQFASGEFDASHIFMLADTRNPVGAITYRKHVDFTRHGDGAVFTYVDGHARVLSSKQAFFLKEPDHE